MRIRFEGWPGLGVPAAAKNTAWIPGLGSFRGRSWLVAVAFGLWIGWVEAGTRRPYLPAVGPAPLRVGSTAVKETARVTLPPLDLGFPTNGLSAEGGLLDEDPVLAGGSAGAGGPGFGMDLGQDPLRSAPWPAGSPPDPGAAVAVAPAPPPEQPVVQPSNSEMEAVSPTVFLEYLRPNGVGNAGPGVWPGTNTVTRIGVVAPLPFQPPPPPASSSATYTVVPGGAR